MKEHPIKNMAASVLVRLGSMQKVFILITCLCSMINSAESSTLTLLDRVITLNCIQEPELDQDQLRTDFTNLCQRAEKRVVAATTPVEKIAALNACLLTDRKVKYLSNIYWRDSTLAAALQRQEGNCLSTSTLYVLVGNRLGLPLHMVLVPRHAFVRWDDGKVRINIETTSKGKEIPDSYYLDAVENAEQISMRWGKNLDENGFLAELTESVVRYQASAGKLSEAQALLAEVERLAPWRIDLQMQHIVLTADITKDRASARTAMNALLKNQTPASVATAAISWLADDAGAQGNHLQRRKYLLLAFATAPKAQIVPILGQLASCHRALKDWRGAVRYYELVLASIKPGDPTLSSNLYNYAILLKNDNRLPDALTVIDQAIKLNPEEWNLTMLKAGYLCLSGRMEEGKALRSTIKAPRADAEFWAIMHAWFFAVSAQKQEFYKAFSIALENAHSEGILNWIDEDVDLDPYRQEVEFKRLVDEHRKRLMGDK